MPEQKPWEKYSSGGESSKPWESYSNKKGEIYKDAFTSKQAELYAGQPSDKVENAIDFISKDPTTKGGMIDVDKAALRDVLGHPTATVNQRKEAIATMQSGNPYYIKDENGVPMPKELKDGKQPPKGYDVQSVWGTKKDAANDAWYTDLSKSLYNGVLGAVEGVAQLGQLGSNLITDSESETLGSTINAINSLKLTKDEALNKTMYNTEGIKEWGDLVSKDRFDLSPDALWGTLNSVAESVTTFMTGAGAAGQVAKGAQGVAKLANLSKGAQSAAAFTGSFLQQLGDNLDDSREAGLTGRDAGAVAMIKTTAQAAIDASFGLESKIFKNIIGEKADKEIFKNIVRNIERDADGKITEAGFKQLAKEATDTYAAVAKSAIKEVGKDALIEGSQEVGQDFVAKSAEQLWDKMSDEDKAKFGTYAFDAKSFGSYVQNFFVGLVGGLGMAPISVNAKKTYEEQSANAYRTVQKGEGAVNELKANLLVAKEKGTITPEQHDQAITKIDAYQKYHEQTKDLNLDDKQKKNAFELSFNIEALKKETEIPKEDLDQLDPIAHAKIDSKKKLMRGLQEELNKLVLREDIQKETKVGESTVQKVAKDIEPKEGTVSLKGLLRNKIFSTPTDKVTIPDENKPYKRYAYNRDETPHFDLKDDKGTYEFNKLTDPISKKRALTDHFYRNPQLKDEIKGQVYQGQNNVWQVDVGDGRWMQAARSIDPKTLLGDTTNMPDKTETVKDSDGRPLTKYTDPVIVKMETITSDRKGMEGKPLRIFNLYRASDGKYIVGLKEKQKGDSKYTDNEIAQMEAIKERGYMPKTDEEIAADVKQRAAAPVDIDVKKADIEKRRQEDFNNENESYRVIVGDEAFNDIVESGVVRTNAETKSKKKGGIDLSNRPTAYPSFSKGKASMDYAAKNPNNYIIVTEDSSIQPSKVGRHGKGTTMFPTDENGNHLKELSGEKIKVYKHIGNGEYILVYANGKEINAKYDAELAALENKTAETEKDLDAFDQADKEGAPIDIDVVARRREQLKKKEPKVKKPSLKLKEIKGKDLAKVVSIKKSYKGESVDVDSTVDNEQKKVIKKFEQLQKVLDCIHG